VSACLGFPLCTSHVGTGTAHIQLTHRILAYLLALHLVGLAVMFGKRKEAPVVVRTSRIAVGLVALQIALGAAMVTGHYLTPIRSLHQATGISIWLTAFVLTYLARISSRLSVPAFATAAAAPGYAPVARPHAGDAHARDPLGGEA
jgi:heme A synthase